MKAQRGGFVLGLVVGLLVGLAIALGVALYITKAPVPFMNKVPLRTQEQDNAEAEHNKNWDPNAALSGKAGRPAGAASGAVTPAPAEPAAAAASAPAAPQAAAPTPATAAAPAPTAATPQAPAPAARNPAAILSGGSSTAPGPEAFIYYVQVGAFTRNEEAEQQRAKLALVGYSGKISEREQSGRTVYRVRIGPFDSRDEADGVAQRLQESNIDARLVRVEKP